MTAAEKIADLSVLWKQASAVFPFFDRRTLDWDETYREYLDKVMKAESEREFHMLLAEFVNLLGDGHTDYTLPKDLAEETGVLPFSLRYVQGCYCIRAIKKGGEQHLASRVLSINGVGMQEIVSELSRYIYHVGDFVSRPNQFLPFLLKRKGNVMETTVGAYCFDLEKTMPEMTQVEEAKAAMPYTVIPSGKLEIRVYDDGILYVKMDDFLYRGAADEVSAVLRERGNVKGVILDVRNNIGGMTKFASAVAELFISGEFKFLKKHTRTMTGADIASAGQILLMKEEERAKWCDEAEVERCRRINANAFFKEWEGTAGESDHEALYSGPCVILTSRYTVSAAEDFVAMFRSTGRATVMGEPTQGTTGTPLLLRLSGGGRARICSIGNRLVDGAEFIGVGMEPDVLIQQSAEDYASGTDTVLNAALKQFAE